MAHPAYRLGHRSKTAACYKSGDAAKAANRSTRKQMTNSTAKPDLATEIGALLAELGVAPQRYLNGSLPAPSAVSGKVVAQVQETTPEQGRQASADAPQAFLRWRLFPSP
jgi:hypothetical protein